MVRIHPRASIPINAREDPQHKLGLPLGMVQLRRTWRGGLLQAALLNIYAGWIGMLAGILSGALLGWFFHNDDWMGGYGSYRRRLTRLGHVSFFGLGFLNLLFGLSAGPLRLSGMSLRIASWSCVVAALTMPACCFLTAWRKPLRHLFPIPVFAALITVLGVLLGAGIR